MIHITQLIYIKQGQEKVFHDFEDLAIPIISKYNGRLTLRVRPEASSYIAGTMDAPYEIHIVEFDTEQDFENFKLDPERKNFLHLKEQAIQTILMIKGEVL